MNIFIMSKTKNTVQLSVFFIFVFVYGSKNLYFRVNRKFFISLKITWTLMFGESYPFNAIMLRIILLSRGLTDLNFRYQDDIEIILSSITQHRNGLRKLLLKKYRQAQIIHPKLQGVFVY